MEAKKYLERFLFALILVSLITGSTLFFFRDKARQAYHALKLIYLSRSFWRPTLKDYSEVSCPRNPLVVGYFGQSNSANFVFPRYDQKIPQNLYQFDWRTGRCYKYKEPLLGADGLGGSTITHFATKLALDTSSPILIAPFGQGGSSAFDWAEGFLASRHEAALEILDRKKLKPVVFFWHQGEMGAGTPINYEFSNAGKAGGDQDTSRAYEIFLTKIIDKTRKTFPDSYFGIALASLCKGKPSEAIRAAQRSVAAADSRNFVSADTDMVTGHAFRYDKCHISQEGAIIIGTEYYNSFLAEANKNTTYINGK